MRLKIIRLSTIAAFIIILLNLIYIQVIKGGYYFDLSLHNRIRLLSLEGPRGRIKDRHGKILADNRFSYDAAVVPWGVDETQPELFSFLSKVLSLDQKKLLEKYEAKRTASFVPVLLAEDISRDQAILLEENKYRFPSLLIQEAYRRQYPFYAEGAHLLGYVGKINRLRMEELKEYGYVPQSLFGYGGVEEYYDAYLRGEEGGVQIEVDNRGQQVRLLGLKDPRQGQDITLTVDADIQVSAQRLLEGKSGVIILMDADNGEILGLTSAPTFDPNVFLNPQARREVSALFSHSSSPLFNRAIQGVFPPGSVFKMVVALSALSTQKINSRKTFFCPGFYELGGMKFGCTHEHGTEDLEGSLAHSCNVYYYNLGLLVGAQTIYKYAHDLGLGSLTYIDLPYEEKGFVPHQQKGLLASGQRWYAGDTLNLSIGQGMTLTTPLQLARMMALVASDGKQVHPHVIKMIGEKSIERYDSNKEIPLDKNILKIIQKALRQAVVDSSGTAHALNVEGLYVAGKTGTAQSSGKKENHAWLVGYVKGKKNISFCVFLEHGGSSYNACVIARDLLLDLRGKGIL